MVFNNRKALVVAGGMAALLFAINMALGTVITMATGIPIASIVVTGVFFGFFMLLVGTIGRSVGSLTVWMTLYAVFSIPTVLMGPPGIYKVGIGFMMGVGMDLGVFLLRRKKVSYYLGLILAEVFGIPLFYLAFIRLGLPGQETFMKLWWAVGTIAIVTGSVGIFFSQMMFDRRLKNLSTVKALMSVEPPEGGGEGSREARHLNEKEEGAVPAELDTGSPKGEKALRETEHD